MNPVLTKEMAEFNRLYKETDNIYTRYAAAQGVSTTTLCVLYSLYSSIPCTQTQLVEDWGIPMQTVNSCLKAMEKSGIVRLEYAEGNRKSKRILLTAQGRTLTDRIVVPLVDAENRALGALNPEERQLLLTLTKKHSNLLQDFLLQQD